MAPIHDRMWLGRPKLAPERTVPQGAQRMLKAER